MLLEQALHVPCWLLGLSSTFESLARPSSQPRMC